MKKLLTALIVLALVLLCSGALAEIVINGTFADPVFIEYVTRNFDDDKNGTLTREEYLAMEAADFLALNDTGIKDLTGIECFKNVEELQLRGCRVTELDLRKLRKLVNIDIGDSPNLTKLVLRTQNSLGKLNCENCKLTSLDVSGAPNLVWLECQDNRLTSLTLGTNNYLKHLWCYGNNLTALDVSKCPKIDIYPTSKLMFQDSDGLMLWGWEGSLGSGFRMDSKVVLTTSKGLYNVQVDKITLNKEKAVLTRTADDPKPTLKLKAKAAPENARKKAVTWKSSNPKVAAVDENGTVTALKAGKATITCTAVGGIGVKASCKITVEDVLAQEIILNKSEATLTRTAKKLNPTLKLKAKKVTPKEAVNTEVTWKSSNTKVATVDPKTGKVTALKAGTCKITCTAADGSKVKAVCKITVKDTLVTAITLNKKTAKLKPGKTLQLKIKKITPKDAVNQNVKWKSSNKKVATVDKNGKVTAVKAGTCKITCTAADGSKIYVVCEITVK